METRIKDQSSDYFLNNIFFHKYKPIKKLGEGSFGVIYMSENINTKEIFALKFEDKNSGQNLLESEAYVMSYLRGDGIPTVKSYGYSGDYNILVMELLGKSLEDLLTARQDKRFSIKTVCMIGEQMISILECIHTKHIIHRDIKPDNFVMGVGEQDKSLYLLDFGLARKYRSSTTLQHYPMRNRKKLTGTARYASINALRGIEQSRRDDLEAVGYVLMYFLRGSLPWQGLPVKTKEDRYRKIMEKKQLTSPEELCLGFPSELAEFVAYTRNLEYDEEPDYDFMRKLFRKVFDKNNLKFDFVYDWTLPLTSSSKTFTRDDKSSISNEKPKANVFSGLGFKNSLNQNNFNEMNNQKIEIIRETSNCINTPNVDQAKKSSSFNKENREVREDKNNKDDKEDRENYDYNFNILNTNQAQFNDDKNKNNVLKINKNLVKPDIIQNSNNTNTVNTITTSANSKKSKKDNKCCIL